VQPYAGGANRVLERPLSNHAACCFSSLNVRSPLRMTKTNA
jgi:hypothetical protein